MHILSQLDTTFLTWLFGGLAAAAAGCWQVFTYFDQRKRDELKRKSDKARHRANVSHGRHLSGAELLQRGPTAAVQLG